jgi:7-cyano-7-deazaguanine synthase in queuosine biosynthesis
MSINEIKYTNEYGNSTIIPYSKEWKHVGLMTSAGLDSSLLLFLLAKTFKDLNLNIQITPICYILPTKPAADIKRIIKVIKDLTGYEHINKVRIFVVPKRDCWAPFKDKYMLKNNERLYFKYKFDKVFNGDTLNPPAEVRSKWPNDNKRSLWRDKIDSIYTGAISVSPHAFMNKKDIISLYKEFDLLETLAPLTLSCDETFEFLKHNNVSAPCNTCWWCRERMWAFEYNGLDYEKYTK